MKTKSKVTALVTLNKVAPYSIELNRSKTAIRVWSYVRQGLSSTQIQMIFALAAQLDRITAHDLPELFEAAEKVVIEPQYALSFLVAIKKDGQKMRRVVLSPAAIGYQSRGTGRKMKPGQRLFVDFAKYMTGFNHGHMISTYTNRILELAA